MSIPAPARPPRDALLAVVRAGCTIGIFAAVAVALASLTFAPFAFVWRSGILARLKFEEGVNVPPDFIWVVVGVALLIAVTAALGLLFLRELRRIIDTVAAGDPFIPANADRLQRMAWIALAIQSIALPAGALAGWAAYLAHTRYLDIGVSVGGIFLALVLFVLARVFRTGAAMRDELEGTV